MKTQLLPHETATQWRTKAASPHEPAMGRRRPPHLGPLPQGTEGENLVPRAVQGINGRDLVSGESHPQDSRSGYTLITTMVLALCAAIMMAGTLSRTYSGSKLDDRNNAYIAGTAAAEAATEKAMARMMMDFATGGEALLSANLNVYRTQMLPTASENSFWTNYIFSDGQGNANQIYVARTTTAANAPFVLLESQYPGLNAFASTYRILANATPANIHAFNYYDFTNAVCQDVQMAEIPVFQFAIFYNGLLEFTDCAPLTVSGRVQCNTNIYVGCPSGSTLTFNYLVTASGTITNPPWFGYAQSSYVAANITYNGTPPPGWATGHPVLTLPMGAATNSPAAIIQMPASSDSSTNPLSFQRYFYKANMVILVTNVTATNVATTVIVKAGGNTTVSMFDSSPLVFSYTNNLPTNTASYTNMVTNWNAFGAGYWLSTNLTFWDARQGQTNQVTQIDVGKFGTWIATNTNCLAKWTASTPFNGIFYVADLRTTNGQYMDCVRLTNGQNIPTLGATNSPGNTYSIPGLTLATINPLYICGLYNCPAADVASTNVAGTAPCSVICDALTILSPNWSDSYSFSVETGSGMPNGADDTVNTAIIAGNVPSTGSSSTQFSGGVHNLTRLLENWSGHNLWLNTSIINLYPSAQATQQFQAPGIYYDPPTRHFTFDAAFTSSTNLPPGTPQVDRLIRATWSAPPPNNVTYAPSPTLEFVPN